MATRTVDLGSVIGPQGPQGPAGTAGAAGPRGTQWRTGTLLSGGSSTTGAYSSSSMPASLVGDMYLNTAYGYIYQCTTAGTGSTAKWTYKGRFPFLPLTGGTLTGNLRIDSGDTDTVHKLNLGDGEYVYLSEPEDDRMELHATHLRFTGMTEASPNPLPVNQGGTGRTTALPSPRRTARLVIGTSTAGWTADDCDYLCDGSSDHVEINAAIKAMPANGGEIVLLDGTYSLSAAVIIAQDNITLRGSGSGTVLTGGATLALSIHEAHNVSVSDIKFSGFPRFVISVTTDSGSDVHVRISSCTFTGCSSTCMSIKASDVQICNNHLDDGGILLYNSKQSVIGNVFKNLGIINVEGPDSILAGNLGEVESLNIRGEKIVAVGNRLKTSVTVSGTGCINQNNIWT